MRVPKTLIETGSVPVWLKMWIRWSVLVHFVIADAVMEVTKVVQPCFVWTYKGFFNCEFSIYAIGCVRTMWLMAGKRIYREGFYVEAKKSLLNDILGLVCDTVCFAFHFSIVVRLVRYVVNMPYPYFLVGVLLVMHAVVHIILYVCDVYYGLSRSKRD